ncbi:MAG: GTP-binding protein [Asgard group archaeon]|nr:GTP-binding protein [Asgard group archaeon]
MEGLSLSFIAKLFKRRTKRAQITICGLDKAGKTSLVNYLVYGEFRETIPTMGVNRETIRIPKLEMNIYDLGGQESFRTFWANINERSDAVIFVVDSTDYDRFDEAKDAFYNIVTTQIYSGIPVLLLLNKKDLPNSLNRLDFVRRFELMGKDELLITWAIYETSAKTGEGVVEAFTWFINTIKEE